MPVGRTAFTDDNGAFRLFALSPGAYYVVMPPRRLGGTPLKRGFADTYYPGTSSRQQALMVDVQAESTATADIILVETDLSRISGLVMGSSGSHVNWGAVTLRSDVGRTETTTSIRSDGSFLFTNVEPGDYWLVSSPYGSGPGRQSIQSEVGFAAARVTVSGFDVEGVVLSPFVPAGISGTVILPSGQKPSGMTIGVVPLEPLRGLAQPLPEHVKPDGSFAFQAWPGRGLIRVMGQTVFVSVVEVGVM